MHRFLPLTVSGGRTIRRRLRADWLSETAVGQREQEHDDARADHDPGDEMDAVVGDMGVEDDSGDGGGGDEPT